MSIFEEGGTPTGASAGQSANLATEAKSPNHETLDWDSLINGDAQPNTIVPEGDYKFRITGMDRGRYPGSPKLPPSNKAILTLSLIKDDGSTSTMKTDLILAKVLEWKLSSFFISIGQKKKGEEFRMNWSQVVGAEGRAHIIQRSFSGKDGRQHLVNEVDKYLAPVDDDDYKERTFDPGLNRQY